MPSPRGSPRPFPSPRLHIAGEIPPDLSPLDAFAAQSRMLARQLEDSMNEGRRMSRLPPMTIENHLAARPGYSRSISAEPTIGTFQHQQNEGVGYNAEVEEPFVRPVSVHPQLGGPAPTFQRIAPTPTSRLAIHEESDEEPFRGRRPASGHGHTDFGARREQSPAQNAILHSTEHRTIHRSQRSIESMRYRGYGQKPVQDRAHGTSHYKSRALAPPLSPFAQRTPSPRSIVSTESSDDDFKNAREGLGLDRSFSAESGFSHSPIQSPAPHFAARSPSISSEISVGGSKLPRPAFNFSRPISRASMNGIPTEVPSRQTSGDSQPSFILADDTAHTPVSMHSEGFPDVEGPGAPSYVYSRFALPRGKMLQRNSMIFQDSPAAQQWDQPSPAFGSPYNGSAPPSPPSRPSTSHRSHTDPRPSYEGRPSTSHQQTRASLDPGRPSQDHGFDFGRPSLDPGRSSYEHSKLSYDSTNSYFARGRSSIEDVSSVTRPQSTSASSSATIKPRSSTVHDASAEEHVTKAIEYHEAGALTKSTYHLRLAARQNHPTGMLLYALACRHGWGMRPNQKEGVQWLRKAAESASLEVEMDEVNTATGDYLERKARKAQFALSIYELGVSHMNGWGIEQDKALALKCFEIAGCKLTSLFSSQ